MSREAWIQTASGRRFYYDDVTPEQFHIEDMAAGVSRTCRWGGQLKNDPDLDDVIYVVAQHSVYVYRFLRDDPSAPREALPWALLHDGVEGYYVDMMSPLKSVNPEYSRQETYAEEVFREAYGIPFDPNIKWWTKYADIQLMLAESQVMCAIPSDLWDRPATPDKSLYEIDPEFYFWGPKKARREYMKAYEEVKQYCYT